MKYLLLLLFVPFLAISGCGHKKSTNNVIVTKDSLSNDTVPAEENKKITREDTVPVQKNKEVVKEDENPVKDSLPSCIRKMINDANKKDAVNAPLQIDEYLYNNKKVFLLSAPCCDQFNTLYDDDCKPICAPSGGFTGRGDGKCTDFIKTAKHIKTIWPTK